jgi:hypothetical protein
VIEGGRMAGGNNEENSGVNGEVRQSKSEIGDNYAKLEKIRARKKERENKSDESEISRINAESFNGGEASGGEAGGETSGESRRIDKRKNNGRKSKSSERDNVDFFKNVMFSSHLMLSSFLKTPELALNEKESEEMGNAINNVVNAYSKSLIISPQQLALMNLGIVCANIYVPRAVSILANKKDAKKI